MPKNEKSVVGRLIVQYRTPIYAYILACVRNHSDAEDVFQEVASAVVESFEKLREESEFLPWAREIARRQVLSFFRKSSQPIQYDSDFVALLAEASQVESKGQDERTTALRDCLEKLPPKSQSIIQMRYDGTVSSVDQIANQLDRSMAATYGILKRIRIALRSCVEAKLASEELA